MTHICSISEPFIRCIPFCLGPLLRHTIIFIRWCFIKHCFFLSISRSVTLALAGSIASQVWCVWLAADLSSFMRYSPWHNIWFLISLASNSYATYWHTVGPATQNMIEKKEKNNCFHSKLKLYWCICFSGRNVGPNWQTTLNSAYRTALTHNEQQIASTSAREYTKSKWCSALKIHQHTTNAFYPTWTFGYVVVVFSFILSFYSTAQSKNGSVKWVGFGITTRKNGPQLHHFDN